MEVLESYPWVPQKLSLSFSSAMIFYLAQPLRQFEGPHTEGFLSNLQS